MHRFTLCLVSAAFLLLSACAASATDGNPDELTTGDLALSARGETAGVGSHRPLWHRQRHRAGHGCPGHGAGPQCGGIAGITCPGAGQCVDDPQDACAPDAGGADCTGTCRCVETELCVQGDVFDSSPDVCACVPVPGQDPCASVRCAAPTVCEVQADGTAACVPNGPFCGGIAGIECPGAGRCADDPTDSCDPQAGGADCGGVCVCIQTQLCIRGDVFDHSPEVCACVPSP